MVDRIHTVKCEMNRLNRPSHSCCAEGSLDVGDEGGDFCGDNYVRRFVIDQTVRTTTHI